MDTEKDEKEWDASQPDLHFTDCVEEPCGENVSMLKKLDSSDTVAALIAKSLEHTVDV